MRQISSGKAKAVHCSFFVHSTLFLCRFNVCIIDSRFCSVDATICIIDSTLFLFMKKHDHILIQGAWQNNLKGITLRIPLNRLTVITGVSGSGKSSLAFDTIYAEGQRRYVETFSSYARQFLDRMDRPRVDRVDGIPPAIAIDQTNPVRTSRSTVGTMTELNDHIKLLFARAARLYCRKCDKPVTRDTPDTITEKLFHEFRTRNETTAAITFTIAVPRNFSQNEVSEYLAAAGYQRILRRNDTGIEVVQDSVGVVNQNRDRIIEDFEAALKHGQGLVAVYPQNAAGHISAPLRYSSGLHCPDCDIHYKDPVPNLFSFNSPLGACETCRGFGRTIGIDYSLVIPDPSKSLAQGAIKPLQTQSYRECQDDLLRFARRRGVPTDVPWEKLSAKHRAWVIDGEGSWDDGVWYGTTRFFEWLESKSYRMHIRVLLSRYRAYHTCASCNGSRLKPDAGLWRIGEGTTIHQIMLMPIHECLAFFKNLSLPRPFDEAADTLQKEIVTRLKYLVDVGLEYLTLDRQSRTLSGGEVQRINLTTALGTSLVNALFVLDEPSIGLHPRDIGRLIGVLHKLRDAGNTLIVVEHDPELIAAADQVLDLGPGPGEHGGEVVYFGSYSGMLGSAKSATARYLTGRESVTTTPPTPLDEGGDSLDILGAAEHNLKNIDVRIPLHRLVCVTGVSGSGKSTLVQNVCYFALRQLMKKPIDAPGAYRQIKGLEKIGDVVLVDQAPIGKTTRSNPVSYVGAFEPIRKLFGTQPLARERGYTPGTFSFNSGEGRCPRCGGNGFERIEMQFLSDVYLRCPDCNGRRYRPEILEVTLTPRNRGAANAKGHAAKSIADVLEMTIEQACEFFADYPSVLQPLEPLRAVGLSYMRLGQPLPTLSGGEAQRLKLAGHLAESNERKSRHTLFLFDEPTTGLHFSDIRVLLQALRRLINEGHSVVVIEHNLDVVRAADWIIDLGPEGGDAGGEIVCTGTPGTIMKSSRSHTGKALRRYLSSFGKSVSKMPTCADADETGSPGQISIHQAREHNLQNIDVAIPRDEFTVITGVSGSGKSTLAFDILFAEGQRRYLESLNAFARQIIQPAPRPDIDSIAGVPPTVAIEQRTSRGGRKSTVATVTEIYHFLRLLYVKLGTRFCPECDLPIEPQTIESIVAAVTAAKRGKRISVWSPLVVNRKGIYTELAAWAAEKGHAELRVDGMLTPTDQWPRLDRFKEHNIELPGGECIVSPENEKSLKETLVQALDSGHGTVYIEPGAHASNAIAERSIFSTENACPRCHRGFDEIDPRLFSYNSKHGWCPRCFGTGLEIAGFDAEQTGEEIWWNEWFEGEERPCRECHGLRLRPEALSVKLKGKPITHFTGLSVIEAARVFEKLVWEKGREETISKDIISELLSRLGFLTRVGLGYLTLDRAAPSLSGGEAQRIRLASQLGSTLRGVCYILDEPTIGLHARDNLRLIDTLRLLQKKGNTVVVVEHDEMTIKQADHIIDLGPGGGKDGGKLIAQGSVTSIMRNPRSKTGECFRTPMVHPRNPRRSASGCIRIKQASLHNLKRLDISLPLGCFVCVTGVSGSGKSTLVRDILYENARRLVSAQQQRKAVPKTQGCATIDGWQKITRILEVDQRPIGKTPRSCPATYVGFWDDIRKIFARTPEAGVRGYTASRFSFNVDQGRCPECQGQGMKTIEMSFLPDVTVPCEVCGGARFNPETLSVLYKDKTIADVLKMTVDEATGFFSAHRQIHTVLELMQEVGLGYISLGQQSPTLSGGEAQRIKLVTELSKTKVTPSVEIGSARQRSRPPAHSLYVLDEPTIGLHMADVEKLVRLLHRLVDAGNTLVVIEHNLDVMAEADWIIDLGPEGGSEGGRIVAQGTPEEISLSKTGSHTGKFLREVLRRKQ
jgi:excinuclease ABC subunit A